MALRGYFPPSDMYPEDDTLGLNDVNGVGERMPTGLSSAIAVPDYNYMMQALRILKERDGVERSSGEVRVDYSITPRLPLFINLRTHKQNSPLVYGQGIGGNSLNTRRRVNLIANLSEFEKYCEYNNINKSSRQGVLQFAGISMGASEVGERESYTPKEFTYTSTGNISVRWNSDELIYAGEIACWKMPRPRKTGGASNLMPRGPLTCEFTTLKQLALDINKVHVKHVMDGDEYFAEHTANDICVDKPLADQTVEWAVAQKYSTLMNAFQVISDLSDRGIITINGPSKNDGIDGVLGLGKLLEQFGQKIENKDPVVMGNEPQPDTDFKSVDKKLYLASLLGLVTAKDLTENNKELVKASNISQSVFEKVIDEPELKEKCKDETVYNHAHEQFNKHAKKISNAGYESNGMMVQTAYSTIAFRAMTDAVPYGMVEAHLMTECPPASKIL